MLADRLREARQAAGMTQAQAARRIGVSVGRITDWERGYSNPRIEKLPLIARTYGVTTDRLLEVPVPHTGAPYLHYDARMEQEVKA